MNLNQVLISKSLSLPKISLRAVDQKYSTVYLVSHLQVYCATPTHQFQEWSHFPLMPESIPLLAVASVDDTDISGVKEVDGIIIHGLNKPDTQ